MRTEIIEITTGEDVLTDVTAHAARFVDGRGAGLLNLFVPHATAALVVVELDAGSDRDLEALLERLIPHGSDYRHRHGSFGHGADHLITPLLSPSLTIPVIDGRMALGPWQSLVVVDTNRDNLIRQLRLSLLESLR